MHTCVEVRPGGDGGGGATGWVHTSGGKGGGGAHLCGGKTRRGFGGGGGQQAGCTPHPKQSVLAVLVWPNFTLCRCLRAWWIGIQFELVHILCDRCRPSSTVTWQPSLSMTLKSTPTSVVCRPFCRPCTP